MQDRHGPAIRDALVRNQEASDRLAELVKRIRGETLASAPFTAEQEVVAPYWIDQYRLGSPYEEQFDANAAPDASATASYRHRVRRYTGQPVVDWKPGPAPI